MGLHGTKVRPYPDCQGGADFVSAIVHVGIVCYPAVGGSGVVATELAKALACKGYTVHLVSSEPPLRFTSCLPKLYLHQVVPPDYPVFRYKPYESALAGRLVHLAEEGVELIHVHYAIPHAVSAYLAQQVLQRRRRALPVITTLHGTDTTLVSQDPDLHPIVELALHASTTVTAVSQALAKESQKRFRLPEAPLVIPNFVDTRTFCPERRDPVLRSAYASPEEFLLVHASNFRPIKQTPSVIRLFARLVDIGVPARLLLIGDGPDRVHCERLTQELGLGGKVYFLGSLQEIAPLLAIGDVFVLTSRYESFGLAALEAMACGVPVVAPAVGGLKETISTQAGRLYIPDDLEDALKAILSILADLPSYREGALQTAHRYEAHQIVPLYEKAYEQALQVVSHTLPG